MSGIPPDMAVTSSDRRDYKLWEGKDRLVTHIGQILGPEDLQHHKKCLGLIRYCTCMLMSFKRPEYLIIHDNTGGLEEEKSLQLHENLYNFVLSYSVAPLDFQNPRLFHMTTLKFHCVSQWESDPWAWQ